MTDFMKMDRRIDAMTDEEKLFYLWRLTDWYADRLKAQIPTETDWRATCIMRDHRNAFRDAHFIIGDELF